MVASQRISALLERHGNNPLFHAALLGALTCVVFANTLFNSFHLDDFYRVVGNPGIQQVSRPWVHFVDPRTMSTLRSITGYRPILPLTLSINYAISGENVVSYHVFNIAFQVLAAWCVYLLMVELLALVPLESILARPVALLVALVFAVHPVSGIPVNYICARDLVLMQLFWGASFWGYLRMRRMGFTASRWAFVMVLLLLSIGSKGDSVVAPAMVFCLEITLGRQSPLSVRPWLRSLPLLAVVLAFFAFTKVALGYSELGNVVAPTDSFWTYPLTQARLHLFRYLPNFFWPFPMRQDPLEPAAHGLDLQVALGLVFIASTLVVAGRCRRDAPVFTFCILAYWVMYLTTSVVVPFYHLAVDYRPYPSSPYFYLVLVLLGLRLRDVRLRQGLAAVAVAWAAATSVFLNLSWRSERTLWQYAVDHGAGPLAHLNLAMATPDLQTRRALLEEALRQSPDYLLVMVNLGRTLVAQGHVEEGLDRIAQSIRLQPANAQTTYWYGITLAELGRKAPAAQIAARAADLDPRNELYQYQAALTAQTAGDYATSRMYLARLRTLSPNYPEAGFLEGFALQQNGQWDACITAYRAFLQQYPGHVQARFNLAHALMTQARWAEAIPEFTRVLELRPTQNAAHLHLARCYQEVGNLQASREHQALWDASNPPAASDTQAP